MISSKVVVSKTDLEMRSCFDDYEGRVGSIGMVSNGPHKRLSLPKTFGQLVYFKNLEIFKWNGQPSNDIVFLYTAITLNKAYLRVKNKKTSRRSDWETTLKTFCDLAQFPSKSDCGRYLFSSLVGKVVLQGTMSNHRATETLSRSFGFKKVLDCDNFFEYVLGNSESFDAVVDNPPWDHWFLGIYFRFIRFLCKPCIIILPQGATQFECFLNVFGRSVPRTIISKGTAGEKQLKILSAQKT